MAAVVLLPILAIGILVAVLVLVLLLTLRK
jgi:hypothetical protein